MIKKINRLSFSDDCSGGGKKGRKKNGDEGKVNNDHFQHTRLNSNYIFLCISIIKSGFLCSALLRFFSARHSHFILHQKLYALQRPFKAPFTSVFCIQISAHHLSWWNCEFMALKRRVISETVSKRNFIWMVEQLNQFGTLFALDRQHVHNRNLFIAVFSKLGLVKCMQKKELNWVWNKRNPLSEFCYDFQWKSNQNFI